ncbi:MAG TPA: hypothetical protein VNO52_12440, partial [Methylomirabilota bacterium]|nr:hypothetical protein [Methylomirabilota bacterium]
ALVDGADSFEPAAADGDVLARLLWVRCARADEALKAADLLLRDPNLPLVVIDLKMNPVRQLRQISSSVWHRLARLLEPHETTVLVITPRPLVTGATCRVQCDHRSGIEDLARAPADLWPALRFSMLRPPAVAGAQPAVQAG